MNFIIRDKRLSHHHRDRNGGVLKALLTLFGRDHDFRQTARVLARASKGAAALLAQGIDTSSGIDSTSLLSAYARINWKNGNGFFVEVIVGETRSFQHFD